VLLVKPRNEGSLMRNPAPPGLDEETDVEGEPDDDPGEGAVEGPTKADPDAALAEGDEEGHESITAGDELNQNPKPPGEEEVGQSGAAESVDDELWEKEKAIEDVFVEMGVDEGVSMFPEASQVRKYSVFGGGEKRALIALTLGWHWLSQGVKFKKGHLAPCREDECHRKSPPFECTTPFTGLQGRVFVFERRR
jgi:hypothetical protein